MPPKGRVPRWARCLKKYIVPKGGSLKVPKGLNSEKRGRGSRTTRTRTRTRTPILTTRSARLRQQLRMVFLNHIGRWILIERGK